MHTGLICTLTNNSGGAASGTYDGVAYSVGAGLSLTLPVDVAGWFLAKHPGVFALSSERAGVIPEPTDTVTLTNHDSTPLRAMYGGKEYVFEPSLPVAMPEETARYFLQNTLYSSHLTRDAITTTNVTAISPDLADVVNAQLP